MSRMPTTSMTFLADGRCEDEQLLMEERFFRELRLRNGTFKTTYAARMPELDAYCVSLAPPGKELRLLDIGVSSGVTSLELLRAFDRAERAVALLATDLVMDGRLFRWGGCELLIDSSDEVLQVAIGRLSRGRPHEPSASRRRAFLDKAMQWTGRIVQALPLRPVQIPIVSKVLARRPDVNFCEADVFSFVSDWDRGFWLVRAANILNLDYFSAAQLRSALRCLIQYVQCDGILVLNRTIEPDRANHGTIFRRDAQGQLHVLCRIGRGSEIEALALDEAWRLA